MALGLIYASVLLCLFSLPEFGRKLKVALGVCLSIGSFPEFEFRLKRKVALGVLDSNIACLFYFCFISISRIRTETQAGAWCPRNQVSNDSYEWLEIDLGKLTVITLLETQGRFGNGQVSHL